MEMSEALEGRWMRIDEDKKWGMGKQMKLKV